MKTQPETVTLVMLETEWFGGRIKAFVEVHSYEVKARVTAKSLIFHYGDGQIRKIVPRFRRWDSTPNNHWCVAYSAATGARSAKWYLAYTVAGFANRILRPTLESIVAAP